MGIALLTFVDLLMPLQSLASRWMPARRMPHLQSSQLQYVAVRPSCGVPPAGGPRTVAAASRPAPALRVVRVSGQQPGERAGRVVLSGRIGDVCAELDRLAALEAAASQQTLLH